MGAASRLSRSTYVGRLLQTWFFFTLSLVSMTSASTHEQPMSLAARMAASVFSGAAPLAPRCPITRGSREGMMTPR